LRAALAARFPRAEVMAVSARDGSGLDAWFSKIEAGEQGAAPAMEVDYDLYADGEALLGWYNSTVRLESTAPFEAEPLLLRLCREIQQRLQAAAEVAHLKMTLSPDDALAGEIAAVNLVRNDVVAELSLRLPDPVAGGQLIINLRAEGAPDSLAEAVAESLRALEQAQPGLRATTEHLEHFRPGRPTPTHRDLASV
jgi:hypothetical protein